MSRLLPESFWLTNSQVNSLILGVWGHALRTAALDPQVCDQALSHSQPHPGYLFTLASSVCLLSTGASSTPSKIHILTSHPPPPFPSIACWEPPGGSSLSWISSLPSLPFRKLNLKKLLPIRGKLIQGSQGDPALLSRAARFKLKILSLPQKNSAQGVALWLLYCRWGNGGQESIFGPTKASRSGEKAVPDIPAESSFSFAFPCFSLGSSPFFLLNSLRFWSS